MARVSAKVVSESAGAMHWFTKFDHVEAMPSSTWGQTVHMWSVEECVELAREHVGTLGAPVEGGPCR